MSGVGSLTDVLNQTLDPLGIFTETRKQKDARKRGKRKDKPRVFTSGDSLLSGSPESATTSSGTVLGG